MKSKQWFRVEGETANDIQTYKKREREKSSSSQQKGNLCCRIIYENHLSYDKPFSQSMASEMMARNAKDTRHVFRVWVRAREWKKPFTHPNERERERGKGEEKEKLINYSFPLFVHVCLLTQLLPFTHEMRASEREREREKIESWMNIAHEDIRLRLLLHIGDNLFIAM